MEEDLEDSEIIFAFVSHMWDVAIIWMAAGGMRVPGKSPDGLILFL